VHGDILRVLDGVDALSYAEESCELPDFLNVRKAKKRSTGSKPATFWYDSRGQN
jgi:hypothetical protein